ncbi:serine--tRNA ligase [Candidatus Woesearchaeota archaeon]|nr:serine--tRNA ligase [Candidatus Woesearchaeota archaeon]
MLDLKQIKDNPQIVKNDLKKRGQLDHLKEIDELLAIDQSYRDQLAKLEALRADRNKVTLEINQLAKQKKDVKKKVAEAKDMLAEIQQHESRVEESKKTITNILMRLPNILHPAVPLGKDDSENKVLRVVGKPTKHSFPTKSHVDLLEQHNLADIERAAKVSGARFYYLKDDLVLLDLALQRFALDHLAKKEFTLLLPPYLLRRAPYEGVTSLGDFEETLYKIEGEDLYLIATSEHPLAAMHMDEVLVEEQLPLKYAGVSPCFRKEAGAHGKDTKGIFRVHQFTKVEQFVFCKPEDSWKIHEQLIKNAEELFQLLELPYRVVDICTGDIGTVAARKYDLEVWMPAQQCYREAVSCSNCTDYQARRLNIKWGKEGGKKEYVHTLNSTAFATTRVIVALLENFQQKNGSIAIPKALQPYCGKTVIGKAV